MIKKNLLLKSLITAAAILSMSSCGADIQSPQVTPIISDEYTVQSDITEDFVSVELETSSAVTQTTTAEITAVSTSVADYDITDSQTFSESMTESINPQNENVNETSDNSIIQNTEYNISNETVSSSQDKPASNNNSAQKPLLNNSFEDNIWAAFLVNPSLPAYTEKSQGEQILDVLSNDSVIGYTASLSRNASSPSDTVAYGTNVITAGGPVSYSSLAYGKLSEIPDSFLNAMVEDMRDDIGYGYGGHSSGAGMGYRTFYQASYDVDTGGLQVSQRNGYWARTLGAFSEHCAGVAVDFDISYHNSDYLESTGRNNKSGYSNANVEFKWLADNAYKYGFIWRYKIDGSDSSAKGLRTGTIREGWHWRFVGVYHATKFWEQCAVDTDYDGVPDSGYMTNDNYVWEDYYYDNISGNAKYPQSEYEAFCEFYNSDKGNKCSYQQYKNR